MDVILLLEKRHASGDLRGNVEQGGHFQLSATRALQIIEKAAVLHQFGDDVDGLLDGAHGIQLYEIRMSEFLHDGCFGEKVSGIHRTWFECLDGDGDVVVPHAFPHVTELSVAEPSDEFDIPSRDFPFINEIMR